MEELSSEQFMEWMAYYTIEPFGEGEAWLRSGIQSAVVANAHRSKKHRAFKPSDFIPDRRFGGSAPKKKQSVEEMRNVLLTIHSVAKARGLTKIKEDRGDKHR